MTRKLATLIVIAALTLAAVSMAFAEGNARKGKYLYRKNCRSCHGVNASDLSPSSKTQAEWKKVMGSWQSLPCVKQWPAATDEDRIDIFTYLHDYAKDSPTPAKCS